MSGWLDYLRWLMGWPSSQAVTERPRVIHLDATMSVGHALSAMRSTSVSLGAEDEIA